AKTLWLGPQPQMAPSQRLCHSQLLGMSFPRLLDTQMPWRKVRSSALAKAVPTGTWELLLKTLCWFITGPTHSGKRMGLRLGRSFDHIPGVGENRGPARGSHRLWDQLLSLCDG
uniref:Uncharacterized protein n=1 Tax=Malurus cyaneus samueli TaxID=2593467 RepID=A0A8C5U5H7_9PASS